MLAAIVRFAVRFRGVVVATATLLLVYGCYQLFHAGLDIFPEFSPKQVIIQTEAPGLAAEQVEVLVTQHLESALGGIIGLQTISSESLQGLSVVTLIFEDDTDIYRNRQLAAERLAIARERLPPGAGPPVIVPLSSSSATVMTIGVTSQRRSLMDLRTIVDWTLVPRLMSVPGVADVNIFGGDVRQLQVQVRPARLHKYRLSLQDVAAAVSQAAGTPGLGVIENANQQFAIQVAGQADTARELGDLVLRRHNGANVLLSDVAKVTVAAGPPIGAAQIMGQPGVVMMIIGQYGANTFTVSQDLEAALAELEGIFEQEDVTLHSELFRPANYIETSLTSIGGHLLIGGALVISVLLIFLYNVRTALISAIAIPLSLLSAATLLVNLGVSLNIMVLGGLAIALGEVVDDAIIDTENIFRRLRENRRLAMPQPMAMVIFNASMEVRGSVVYATFIVALVFVPLLTLGGVAGRLFAPLGIAYILAIMASLVVALTVTPALCYLLLANGRYGHQDPPLIRWLKPRYGRLVTVISRKPRSAMAFTAVTLAAGLSILPLLGGEFLPELREGHYMVHTASVPGTALEESIRIGSRLTERFLDIPGVVSVSQWAGRAERGADTYGSHYSEFEVDLEPMSGSAQQRVFDRLRAILENFPGIVYEANTFLIERVDETISGYTAPVVVNIYGKDLDELDALARQAAAAISAIGGAHAVQLRSPPGTPLVRVRLMPERLINRGVRPMAAIQAIQIAYEGAVVGKAFEGNRVFDVAVALEPAYKRNPQDIGQLPIKTLDGGIVPLAAVADIEQASGRYSILHRGAQRVQTVTADAEGRDLASFFRELQARVEAEVDFSADTYPEYTGAAVEQVAARNELIVHSVIAGAGVLVLIYIALGNLRNVLLILVNVPFSLVGGVVAALATGGVLSVGSMVGFVTLFGITVRNSIMLISHYQHLVADEGMTWGPETALRGAQERLTSILVTALVTALAMLPIAVDSDNPGREIMGPMAAVIIGGLASSTVLNLLIMPTIMLRYGRFERRYECLADDFRAKN
ncbi:MAG: efflux RND transporter permease subunit [Gammaproteobacteria bacterium]